ncbi:hypothetical protein [Mucilaginibacter antarcticus]|uniref:Glycoside hydrolase n=1 Tax=Mucilaginibacter antarcticus TaxID=1855725 RepID=A0ABW5XQK9_9SPHI
MKRKIFITAMLLSAAMICFAALADLTGKWKGNIKMSDGTNFPVTYQFKADGEKLTGTVVTPQDELEIYDGKIKDKDFTFKVDVNDNAVPCEGKFYGDSVVVSALLNGAKLKSTLKRVVAKQ